MNEEKEPKKYERVESVLFQRTVTEFNLHEMIENARPNSLAFRKLAGFFADHFREEGSARRTCNSKDAIATIYSHAANVLGDVVGDKTLQHQVHRHQELFSLLYIRDADFRIFMDKFFPHMITINEKEVPLSEIEEVEQGKIVAFEFPKKSASTYVGDEAVRARSPILNERK